MEAVVNKSRKPKNGGKTIPDYQVLMTNSFREMARVLKPEGKIHLVFNNTDGNVWAAIISALEEAGLRVSNAVGLDKFQKSVKGNKSANGVENVATTDVIFELRHQRGSIKRNSRSTTVPLSTEHVLKSVWDDYLETSDRIERKFLVADFYQFLIRKCSERRMDVSALDYSRVKEFVASL